MGSCDEELPGTLIGGNMATRFEIDEGYIAEQNDKARSWLAEDYDHLSRVLRRRNVDIEDLVA